MEIVYVLLVVGGLVAFLVLATRYSRQLDAQVLARLAPRGFVAEPSIPAVDLGPLRFESRVAFRAKGTCLVLGRGVGEQLGDQPMTSTGHYFYIVALLDDPRDEAFRKRFKGDARALQAPDGKTLVYWQRKQFPDEVERCLRELETP